MGLLDSGKQQQERIPLYKDQVREIMKMAGQLAREPAQEMISQYAGLDPLQQESLGMQEAYARNVLPTMSQMGLGSWMTGINAPDVGNNPYVQNMLGTLGRQYGQLFNEQMLPGIRQAGLAGGTFGGTRGGVAGALASERAMRGFGDAANQMMLGAYGQGLGQQREAWRIAPQMMQFGMAPASTLYGVGQTRQADELSRLADLQRQQDYNLAARRGQPEWYGKMYSSVAGPYGETNVKGGDPSMFSQLTGLGLAAAPFFMGGQGFGMGGFGGPTPSYASPTPSYGSTLAGGGGMPPGFMNDVRWQSLGMQ